MTHEEIEELILNGLSRRKAKQQGISERQWDKVRENLIRRGMNPKQPTKDDRIAPRGFVLKGTSTLYSGDKEVIQWVKTDADKAQQLEMMQETIASMIADVPKAVKSKAPKKSEQVTELCTVYTLTDCHIGMYAWAAEGGSEWNLKIAEDTLVRAFEQLMIQSPASHTCVINQLGDWFHYDSMESVTPTNRHQLDPSGRPGQMIEVGVRALRRIVDLALLYHTDVKVIVAQGNHDLFGSLWLRELIRNVYETEPRVRVDTSETPYHVIAFGETMLGFHHGHKMKAPNLPLYFAADYPTIWGRTKYRYCHIGHQHHIDVKEYNGMIVQQHPTLAARDAYSSYLGHTSHRSATAITYHMQYGQVSTVLISPDMLNL